MGENTHIQWCHHTFNIVVGCVEVSPACDNCYARAMAKRAGWDVWGADKPRKVLRDEYWKQPAKWDRAATKAGERHRVFCSSMADVFEDHPTVSEQRQRLWGVIEATPHLDWLLLTKRPENIRRMVPGAWLVRGARKGSVLGWPDRAWVGTTIENQTMAEERIPHLLRVPAAVRFLSCEPLLEPLDLRGWIEPTVIERSAGALARNRYIDAGAKSARCDWVIVGGESGPRARPFDVAWARDLLGQCGDAGVPTFVKQFGANVAWDGFSPAGGWWPAGTQQEELKPGSGWRIRLHDRAGGDPAEWPEDLRVRDFPKEAA